CNDEYAVGYADFFFHFFCASWVAIKLVVLIIERLIIHAREFKRHSIRRELLERLGENLVDGTFMQAAVDDENIHMRVIARVRASSFFKKPQLNSDHSRGVRR